jgi:CDP-diacylglycerol--serine O-phosphatidyltransferase
MAYRFGGDKRHGRREGHRPPGVPGGRRRRAARMTVSVLPTLFTLGNLISGFISIYLASRIESPFPRYSQLSVAAVFIFVGMVMDALDGSVARLTHSTSDLGGQLDSMADMITFGAAPAFLAVQIIGSSPEILGGERFENLALVIGMIYVSCAALRLARFNVEIHLPTEADHSTFKGLPSPGAAGTVASLALLHEHYVRYTLPAFFSSRAGDILGDSLVVAIMLLVALAMVSKVRYAHLVNRYLRGRRSVFRFGKVIVVALLLMIRPWESMALAFTLYAMSAPSVWAYRKLTTRFGGGPGGPSTVHTHQIGAEPKLG